MESPGGDGAAVSNSRTRREDCASLSKSRCSVPPLICEVGPASVNFMTEKPRSLTM